MTATPVAVEIRDHIATVTVSRPPVNAVDRATNELLRDTFRSFADNRDVRVVVFTGAGDRAFIAGADLKEQQQLASSSPPILPASAELDRGRAVREAFLAIRDCAVPVIGAINGPAIGAGMAYAAMCDVLFAVETATFSAPEIGVGLLGAYSHLQRLVGPYRARSLFLSGGSVSAHELQRLGTVEEVVGSADLLRTVYELAGRIAAASPIAVRLAKEVIARTEGLPLGDAYRLEQDYTTRLRGFADSKEALLARAEGRAPRWSWE
ncbi:enoyl-CoA hydratase/isomerase family protein [Sporichthya brevicatena]|uniref:Enoyl-CoA hydratase/isomerase family protein n=1 Tax=Sporichthya brevicatena TaxID=171442 RepID=A0ABP3RVW8_9ACTN